jgi:acyl-CoA synthetase (AMP-forming)/AMP-acid ligase II
LGDAHFLLADALGFPQEESMLDRLHRWAEHEPARGRLERVECLARGEFRTTSFTAPELLQGAARAAGALWDLGVRAGDRVVLCLPNREPFAHAFLGAQWLGAAPVPLPPLGLMTAPGALLERIRGVMADCAPSALVADATTLGSLRALDPGALGGRPALEPAELLAGEPPLRGRNRPEHPALIQYTSGSVTTPRGVVVTHGNLGANLTAIARRGAFEQSERLVSWLPGFHDMGLIGGLLIALHHGHVLFWMAAQDFLSRPPVWLRAISHFRANLSGAPNSAYRLCLRMAKDRALGEIDLSSWRWAFCGAEPVDATTMRGFAETFRRYGFPRNALHPVYGLAEGTLAATFPDAGEPWHVDRVDRDALAEGQAVPANGERVVELVSVGRAMPGHEVRVVDPATGEELGERRTGEIVYAGPSVTPGYHGQPPREGPVLRTGDLGYVAEGRLYVVDRIKDLIIIGGRNVSPVDVERAAQVEGVRMGRVVALGVPDPEQGTEAVVVLVEPSERKPEALAALRARVDRVLREERGLAPKEIVLLPAGTLERTSSGKLMRRRMRDRYLGGELAALALG